MDDGALERPARVRAKAIVALRCVSRKPLDAAPAVISMLADSDADVRKIAASELLHIRRSPAEIGELLHNADPAIVNFGLDQILGLGDSAVESLPDVLMVLKQEELEDRLSMPAAAFPDRFFFLTRALSSMKTAARPAIPHLLHLIEARRDSTRVSMAHTLVEIGIEPEELIRALTPLLLDDDPSTVSGIGWLIVHFRPEAARQQVSILIPQLEGEDNSVNTRVLAAISALGPEAREAAPILQRLAKSEDKSISEMARKTLFHIDRNRGRAAPVSQ
jgi:HEAT repeat protein